MKYETYVFIADLHALNFIQNADELRSLSHELILDYLGIGLDPEKVTFF
jgi:tryptophanyl-tRNA synthetase